MEEELINMNTEEYENDSAISQLIEYGRQKSIVTIDDILRFFPDAEQDVDQLEEAFSALLNAGIQYTEENASDDVDDDDLDLSDIDEDDDENAMGLSDDLSNIDTDDTIGLYVKEVSRVPLLTADEEVELVQRIEKGRISREELARVNVTHERRLELRKNIEDSWAARDHLITANSRLVISVAKKYMGRGVPFLDLIQEATDDEEDSVLGDFIEDDDAPAPADSATYNLLKEHLSVILNDLPPREVRILQLRYGLLDGQAYTLEEVGNKMGVTRERVRQIEAQALSRLRHPSVQKILRDYLRDDLK